jgi:geranylgeranyl pyrophosphate synthase
VLAAKAPAGGELEPIDDALIRLAGAVELVHLATLFHDDVIDQVDTRRTKLSARLKYGNYASVLTGDFALAEALELVHRSGVPAAMPEFIRTLRVLVRGESLETTHKYNYSLSEAQYYEIISEKSASLFALSCKAGAMAAGGDYADALGHFGWNLGMAFQMIDDLDDMLDNPQRSYDCDLRNGYIALPLIRVLDALKDGHRERLVKIIEKADFKPETERYIVDLCLEYGATATSTGPRRRSTVFRPRRCASSSVASSVNCARMPDSRSRTSRASRARRRGNRLAAPGTHRGVCIRHLPRSGVDCPGACLPLIHSTRFHVHTRGCRVQRPRPCRQNVVVRHHTRSGSGDAGRLPVPRRAP